MLYREEVLLEISKRDLDGFHQVVDSLGDDDYNDFDDIGKNVYLLNVEWDGNTPKGFIYATKNIKNGEKVVSISIAVSPDYRMTGLGYTMAKKAITQIEKDPDIKEMYWGFETSNIKSKNLATKLGFKYSYTFEDCTVYSKRTKWG